MPLLGALLVNLFGGLAGLFVHTFAKKVAIGLAALATFTAVTAALFVAMRAVIEPVVAQLFVTGYGQIIGLAFPPVAGLCINTIVGTWLACTLYAWQRKAVTLISTAA